MAKQQTCRVCGKLLQPEVTWVTDDCLQVLWYCEKCKSGWVRDVYFTDPNDVSPFSDANLSTYVAPFDKAYTGGKHVLPHSIWKVRYWQRTYWVNATVEVKDYRPGFGWLLVLGSGVKGQICRNRVKFIEEVK